MWECCMIAVNRLMQLYTIGYLLSQAKYAWVTGLSPEDAAWMAELPFTLSVPSRRIIIAHAGVLPGVPLPQQSLGDLYTVRDASPNLFATLSCLPNTDNLNIAAYCILPRLSFPLQLLQTVSRHVDPVVVTFGS